MCGVGTCGVAGVEACGWDLTGRREVAASGALLLPDTTLHSCGCFKENTPHHMASS